jgi:enamine deaminase RidA (YjgF/YER057c/UK114 family)
MKHEIWPLRADRDGLEISLAIENVIQNLMLLSKKSEFKGKIISLTFFIDSDKKLFNTHRNHIISRLKDVFKIPPAFSIIGQPPAPDENIRLDVNILLPSAIQTIVKYEAISDDISYTQVETDAFCEYYFSGITLADDAKSIQERIFGSFQLLERILVELDLGMDDIVRQWNYLEDIIELGACDEGMQQNYQSLNNIRHTFYSRYVFNNGYPAATGIGMNSGGFVLECIAIKARKDIQIIPIKNPVQISAYDYSDNVLVGSKIQGLSTPKFERAKLYTRVGNQFDLLISGTAAIQKEKSLAGNDVDEQTKITLENIDKLLTSASLLLIEGNKKIIQTSLSYLRVYIKRKEDFIKVKSICDRYAGLIKPVYLFADICRDELLVEIEGIYNLITN